MKMELKLKTATVQIVLTSESLEEGRAMIENVAAASALPSEAACRPKMDVPEWLEASLENIDAGMFSGDTFHDPGRLEVLGWYVARWLRESQRIRDANFYQGEDEG